MCWTASRAMLERLLVPCCTRRLYFCAAATICFASNMSCEQGFSTYTSLPAWQAQMVCSVWWWFGVAIETASIDLVFEQLAKIGEGRGTLLPGLLDFARRVRSAPIHRCRRWRRSPRSASRRSGGGARGPARERRRRRRGRCRSRWPAAAAERRRQPGNPSGNVFVPFDYHPSRRVNSTSRPPLAAPNVLRTPLVPLMLFGVPG